MTAAAAGDLDTFEVLLEYKADVHYRVDKEDTSNVLVTAVKGANEDIVTIVLDNYVDINAPLGKYGTALQVACLVTEDSGPELVQFLLERDSAPDVNMAGGKYLTALQAACYRGYEEAVESLLVKGADVSIQGGFYSNTLNAAASQGPTSISLRWCVRKWMTN